MGYIDQNLLNGERIVYRTTLHWIIFFWSGFFLLAALVLFAADLASIGLICFFLACLSGISACIKYASSEFGISNKRVLVKTGFIRRNSLETLLSKIEGIRVDQNIPGRIFGYGSIIVTGTGGSREPFHRIKDPLQFRMKVQEQIESSQTT